MKTKNSDKIPLWIEQTIDFMAEQAANEFLPTPIKRKEQFLSEQRAHIKEGFELFQDRLKNGVEILIKDNKLPKVSGHFSKRFESVNTLSNEIQKGLSIQECFGFSEEEMKGAYEVASNLFQNQDFEGASDILLLLSTIAPFTSCYWTALGMAEHRKEDLQSAATAYLMGLDPEAKDLSCYLYAANCLSEIDATEEALEILEEGLEANKKGPNFNKNLEAKIKRQILTLKKSR